MSKINLNTILSGPVGSGRNYLSILYALSIVDGTSLEDLKKLSSKETRQRFNDLTEEGQIFNTSFSENISYEDFLERALGIDDKGQITLQNGLLKYVAMVAKQNLVETYMDQFPGKKFELKYNQLYRAFLKEIKEEKISTFISKADKKFIIHRIEEGGNIYVRGENSFSTYYISRAELKKIFQNGPSFVDDAYDTKHKAQFPLGINPDAYLAVYNTLINFEQDYVNKLLTDKDKLEGEEVVGFELTDTAYELCKTCKKYVLIIEHLDVPNAYKIFGDSIVLLDDNKREGSPEETFIYLQYSKMAFSLPPNLYLIGLTGTTTIDDNPGNLTLLNNFDIINVTPNFKDIWDNEKDSFVEGIDLFKLYNTINRRVDILRPGKFSVNPYMFRPVHDIDSLKDIFKKRLIPQLERALGNDLSIVRLILGKDFIGEKQIDPKVDFMDYDSSLAKLPEKYYEITEISDWTDESFKRIYMN